MKTYLSLLILLASIIKGNSQSSDTITFDKIGKRINYKEYIAPVALISGGLLLNNTKQNHQFQSDFRKVLTKDFHTKADDFLQYEGILQIYGGRYLGFKPKNDILHQTINIVIANAIMSCVVKTMKNQFQEERPDKTDHFSFPSGHTATAFTNATLLFYEYKDTNIWFASSGFAFAATTGFLRIANNRHYTSDVLAGAGIGIGIGTVVSYWNPFKNFSFGKNKTQALIYPQMGETYGMGLIIRN